ncbi:hypothetical protein [Ammoniphilus sp. 3BR4]|uniref:hypothetical protein n=1 Tax=Ammoniphilus sp. 3BR4 TaxID=3158265 RepID=UPI0034673BC5
MLERYLGYIPPGAIYICALLSVALPWTVFAINRSLHKAGDARWKADKNQQAEDDKVVRQGLWIMLSTAAVLTGVWILDAWVLK